jgi:hypothetical protein
MWGRGPYLCPVDRKVWKEGYSCPVCGQHGIQMGTKWRAPKQSDGKAWRRVQSGDFLWENSNYNNSVTIAHPNKKPRSDFPTWFSHLKYHVEPKLDWADKIKKEILERMAGV